MAFEWQTLDRTGACDQAICFGMGRAERLLPGEQVLGYLGTRRTQMELPHGMGSTKGDERPGLWVIRVNRSMLLWLSRVRVAFFEFISGLVELG